MAEQAEEPMDRDMGSSRKSLSIVDKAKLVILAPVILCLVVVLSPLILLVITIAFLYRLSVGLIVNIKWIPKAKYLLVIHSNSPNWSAYVNDHLIPAVKENAVLLNWSERKSWSRKSLATHVFHAFVGYSEHTPSVVLFDPWWKPKVYRFWKPFKAYKHGKPQEVDELFQKLLFDLNEFSERSKRQNAR